MNSAYQSTLEVEEALVREATGGDLDAFNQLILLYQDMAYHTAYALVGDSVSAEDVTQDSFIKAFRQIRNFRGGLFRAWLLKIVTNTAYDFLRQSKRHPVQPLLPEDDFGEEIESPSWLVDPSASVETTVEQIDDSRRLYQLLDELPEAFRSVLTLIDIYELDYKEVATILNLPMGTIKSRLARARLQMRRKLLKDFGNFQHFNLPITYSHS